MGTALQPEHPSTIAWALSAKGWRPSWRTTTTPSRGSAMDQPHAVRMARERMGDALART